MTARHSEIRHLHAIPARCRVGFAAYFNPGFLEDHWVCESLDGAAWRLLDAQLEDHWSARSGSRSRRRTCQPTSSSTR